MNKTLLIVAGIIFALFLSLPLLAKLKQQGSGNTAATSADIAPPSADYSAAPSAAPAWNSGNLAGTAWSMSSYTVHLNGGGTASVDGTPIGTVSGTWSVNGSTLALSAMGQKINAQISGDQILVNGQAAQRLQ